MIDDMEMGCGMKMEQSTNHSIRMYQECISSIHPNRIQEFSLSTSSTVMNRNSVIYIRVFIPFRQKYERFQSQ